MNPNFTIGDDHLMVLAKIYDAGLTPVYLSDFIPLPTDMFALGCTDVCTWFSLGKILGAGRPFTTAHVIIALTDTIHYNCTTVANTVRAV
jgi:hypothetical protein